MKPNIHVETPDGEVLKTTTGAGTESSIAGDKKNAPEADDIIAGPKPNPDPFANSNLQEKEKDQPAEGAGTEVTDGEAG